MRHPRSSKPESIANAQSEIQIVDTHESIETRISIGLAAALLQINRTLVSIELSSTISCQLVLAHQIYLPMLRADKFVFFVMMVNLSAKTSAS